MTAPNDPAAQSALRRTPLYDLHVGQGARMVEFAGYSMPVQYSAGIMSEHRHTRAKAGLFDVSHMGQIYIDAPGGTVGDAVIALEALIPIDIAGLGEGRQRYGFFTNAEGGVEDDLMVQNLGPKILLVVNAATKDADEALLRNGLPQLIRVERLENALLALQGPEAENALKMIWPGCTEMRFMDVREAEILGLKCIVSRSGYSGEDGFEISVPSAGAEHLANELLAHDAVELVGLGARDSLRLEAGLCLYGSDLDPQTTPVEAQLTWAISKSRRRDGSRAGGFPGSDIILGQIVEGVSRKRVGLRPEGKAPVRGGASLFSDETSDQAIGVVTSGGFGPSFGGPIAMGYVETAYATLGQRVFAEVRGKRLPVDVTKLPFVSPSYKRA
ncbi:MAG: glycine cleavage system aminomethyltransferase GcvT [Filomicrobium sp.]